LSYFPPDKLHMVILYQSLSSKGAKSNQSKVS